MKKREKFAKEILDIACNGGVIAVTKDNKVVCCRDMNCEQCLFHKKDFYGGYCDDTERIRWSESEYVEKPTITSKEKNFLGSLLSNFKYIARDSNDALYIYYNKPKRNSIDNELHCNSITKSNRRYNWIKFEINISHNDRKLAEKIAQDYLAELRSYGDGKIYDENIKLMNEKFVRPFKEKERLEKEKQLEIHRLILQK